MNNYQDVAIILDGQKVVDGVSFAFNETAITVIGDANNNKFSFFNTAIQKLVKTIQNMSDNSQLTIESNRSEENGKTFTVKNGKMHSNFRRGKSQVIANFERV